MAPPENEGAQAAEVAGNYDFTKLRINLEVFNGDQKPAPKAWLIWFTMLKELYQWERPFKPQTGEGNGEILAAYYMRSFFGSSPLLWLKSLDANVRKDWDLLNKAFLDRWVKGSSDIANETAFSSAKMKVGESPDDFYLRVLELGELCDASYARISTVFLSGINRDMRMFCCSVQKDSSQKYLESALLYHSMASISIKESSNFMGEAQNDFKSDPREPANDDYYGETLGANQDCVNPPGSFYYRSGHGSRGGPRGRASPRERGGPAWSGRGGRGGHSDRGGPRARAGPRGRGGPALRGNKGLRGNANQKPQGACFSCGQQGHTYLQCSDNPKLKGPSCHFSGSKHHFVKKCPYKNRDF